MGLRGLVVPFVLMAPVNAGLIDETGGLVLCLAIAGAGALLYGRITGLVRLPDGTAERIAAFEAGAALLYAPQRRPAMVADLALVDVRLAGELAQAVDAVDDGRVGAEQARARSCPAS